MNFHNNDSLVQLQWWIISQWLILTTMMNFHHNGEFSSQWKIHIKILYFDQNHNFLSIYEFSSHWYIFITIRLIISLWIYITMIYFHHNKIISSQWITFITIRLFIKIKNFHPNDEFSSYYITRIDFPHTDDFSTIWLIFVTLINFNTMMNFHQWWIPSHESIFSTVKNFHKNEEFSLRR